MVERKNLKSLIDEVIINFKKISKTDVLRPVTWPNARMSPKFAVGEITALCYCLLVVVRCWLLMASSCWCCHTRRIELLPTLMGFTGDRMVATSLASCLAILQNGEEEKVNGRREKKRGWREEERWEREEEGWLPLSCFYFLFLPDKSATGGWSCCS